MSLGQTAKKLGITNDNARTIIKRIRRRVREENQIKTFDTPDNNDRS